MLKSGGSILDANPGSDLDAIQQRDLKMALKYFKEASELGDTWATYKVGAAYYYGLGVEESNPSAVTWFRRASAMGSSEAKAQLGIMLVYGHGVERNIEHALKWLNDAAAKDNSTALRELALLNESGTGMIQDLEECTRLMAKAAALGDRMAHDWMTKNCPEKPAWLQDLMAGESQEGGRPEGAPTDSPNDVGPGQI